MQADIEALSGICGSISIACWVVVFSPQIVENFRRSSAEGLSIVFIVIWLAGDVFNILGAVMQGVLPTMIILAVYYTLADIVLLAQCFYYRGFTLKDTVHPSASQTGSSDAPPTTGEPTERSALLHTVNGSPTTANGAATTPLSSSPRRASFKDQFQHIQALDGTHLSPAVPMHPKKRDEAALKAPVQRQRSVLYSVFFNLAAVLVVCAAGFLGWWLSTGTARGRQHHHHRHHHQHDRDDSDSQRSDLHFNVLGQVFGYICAALYLGSRLPQLLLNARRKSTEGISMLFFVFACIGNLTYVLSILAYEPKCEHFTDRGILVGTQYCEPGEAAALYGRNFLVNFSWILGSFGTLLLDAGVFVQYFKYRKSGDAQGESAIQE